MRSDRPKWVHADDDRHMPENRIGGWARFFASGARFAQPEDRHVRNHVTLPGKTSALAGERRMVVLSAGV